MPTFHKTSTYPVSARTLYNWHARDGAFERLSPPWDDVRTVHAEGGIKNGAVRIMKLHKGPLSITWEAHHQDHIEGRQFVDNQVKGPFKRWIHTHRFERLDESTSQLIDSIDYRLPFGPLGAFFGSSTARSTLHRMFTFRHERTRHDVLRHNHHYQQDLPPLHVHIIAPTNNLLATDLVAFLSTGGHTPHRSHTVDDLPSPLPGTRQIFIEPTPTILSQLSRRPHHDLPPLIITGPNQRPGLLDTIRTLPLPYLLLSHAHLLDPRSAPLSDLLHPLKRPTASLTNPIDWLDPDDLLAAILSLATHADLTGEIALKAPHPVDLLTLKSLPLSPPSSPPEQEETRLLGLPFAFFYPHAPTMLTAKAFLG